MKVLIVGWYGTETIGDRGILAGLVQLLTKELGELDLILGSLFPFFSERTIYEDYETIKNTSYNKVNFSIIDTRDSNALKNAVNEVELVIMGGGPLMDLSELYMVEYAFKLAKKWNKKTAILGCGIGPLFQKKYRKTVLSIVKYSDVLVLRDGLSKVNLKEIFHEFSQDFSACDTQVGFDPAVHYTFQIKQSLENDSVSEYISINLRSFPNGYSIEEKKSSVNTKLNAFIESVVEYFPKTEIMLTPMHYFHVGDDDRYFLNEIKFKLNKSNVHVQNEPLTLEETVKVYTNAKFNIGMRFHSVVIQTVASGKNYILDYTQPKKGKISSFICDVDKIGFYDKRYLCLQGHDTDLTFDYSENENIFNCDAMLIHQSESTYQTQIRKLNLS